MTKTLTLAASALALAASGAALAQEDGYTPPAEDETVTESTTLPDAEEDVLYDEDAYEEPQGDANDDDGELVAPGEEELEEDGMMRPGDAATLPETDTETPYGEETEDEALPELEPEL